LKPILWQWEYLTVYSYGVFVALAFFVAYTFFKKRAMAAGVAENIVTSFMFLLLVSGILGGRIFYVIQYWPYYQAHPLEILWVYKGGLVWYGAFLGALLCGSLYIKYKALNFWRMADLLAPYLALAQGIGRLGCFFNGCCYGIHVGEPWGLHFPQDLVPRLPVQIYSAGALALLAMILIGVARNNPRPGVVASFYGIGYALIRFHMEFLRGDQTEFVWGLTLAQVLSVGLLLISVWLYRTRAGGKPVRAV